jgi:hypothetical protein
MKYYIQNQDRETTMIEVENTDYLYETALHTVGYKLHTKVDDGNVHEYMILEKDSNQYIGSLMEYMYERACFEALSSLGFSCDDEPFEYASESLPVVNEEATTEPQQVEYVEAKNIVQFPLLGSKFGTNE